MQTPQLQQYSASAKYPKRQADAEMKTDRNTKKQKRAQGQYVSTKDFRAPSDWGMKQPIGITQAEIPLTNAQAFRLRGWFWRRGPKDAPVKGGEDDSMRCESPRGTRFQ
ncbi:hypothetical protein CFE70_009409 [Pyrenophora teres f. teres 0-1]|uniref:Uncharacterized protein n=2 Tax=Pyrenophora teres f. teres TaxID=97479 RepID=E3RN82_PYRTT|nr:hypothetical protein PTT_10018 [Pyrenophora teres f. teres 0-1]KAE8824105.1 hypothetical protein HRS9139_09287 [Pyrenophora teres f. teres]CAA9966016.1 hypothetical protein PTMSG1_09375 [Pyrenophora teres f. maculata]KAE8827308.1 hypothetical protein PTNB85_08661 [Pyrenophora teres f. teres]KAE8831396.1 hypothetical protein HRS9122_08986 [Pyrenophora teres f. teres]